MEVVNIPRSNGPRQSTLHPVIGPSSVIAVRQDALGIAEGHGLAGTVLARVGEASAHIASNILDYAGGGFIVLRAVGEAHRGCIEIIGYDNGSGPFDITRPSPDRGMSQIRRNVDLFDIYAHSGRGMVVVAHVSAEPADGGGCACGRSAVDSRVSVICVPLLGEVECGDAWCADVHDGRLRAFLVDGLGHGPGAAAAARLATDTFHSTRTNVPELVLEGVHRALRHSRGAALSVAVIDAAAASARFCGVGNVDGRLVSDRTSSQLLPQSGIVGHTMPRNHAAADVRWLLGARLVLHSDGLSSRWRMQDYPGLLARHPALLAGALFRDFARTRDDAAVMVIREPVPPAEG